MDAASQERLARNESFFREVNERIKDVAEGIQKGDRYEFLCECAEAICTERISLTAAEYEDIRSSPTKFALAPGHHTDGVEQVVESEPGHVVVEKVGVAGRIAADLDPRTDD